MVAAMNAVKNGMPIKRAAEEHGVPTTTLWDRMRGSVVHGSKPRPKQLLTSSDAMAGLEENKRKKKFALEEKERRKTERETKKRQKEEEQKRKAEERERKAEENAKKATEKKEAMQSSGRTARKRKANELTAPTGTDQTGPSSSVAPISKKSYRPLQDNDSEIDENVCCVCFVSYLEDVVDGDGHEWIKCACGRWLHEDCTDACVVDVDGKERFCHLCLDILH